MAMIRVNLPISKPTGISLLWWWNQYKMRFDKNYILPKSRIQRPFLLFVGPVSFFPDLFALYWVGIDDYRAPILKWVLDLCSISRGAVWNPKEKYRTSTNRVRERPYYACSVLLIILWTSLAMYQIRSGLVKQGAESTLQASLHSDYTFLNTTSKCAPRLINWLKYYESQGAVITSPCHHA